MQSRREPGAQGHSQSHPQALAAVPAEKRREAEADDDEDPAEDVLQLVVLENGNADARNDPKWRMAAITVKGRFR